MTKRYIVTHNKLIFGDVLSASLKNTKIVEMFNLGKMNAKSTAVHESQFDGTSDNTIRITGTRTFIDQESAEEYRNFSTDLSQQFNLGLVSVVIEDI